MFIQKFTGAIGIYERMGNVKLKIKIWKKRCEEVAEMEQKKGISRIDKRKRKMLMEGDEKEVDVGNLVTKDKAIQNTIDNAIAAKVYIQQLLIINA
ncbi:unnamed protein product [Rhizophagus irregularis]|nr:unnamed protein product [Rhizophagus irregularis]CAB4440467.1 unnamed protein product [Rhizophagus irregularis]